MPARVVAAGCLVGAAVAISLPESLLGLTRRRRLRLLGRPEQRPRPARDFSRPVAGLVGAAAALLIGGVPGVLAGAAVALLAPWLLRRIEPADARCRRLREAGDAPLAADLLAAALRAGAPLAGATGAVARALGGPLGDRLGTVARSLWLGAEPGEAWAHLAGVPGGRRWAETVVRSTASGGALAEALTRLADDLRADRAAAVEAAARRSGVLIVLPLGLCFLPAFVLAGLVPVIVAVLGDVL